MSIPFKRASKEEAGSSSSAKKLKQGPETGTGELAAIEEGCGPSTGIANLEDTDQTRPEVKQTTRESISELFGFPMGRDETWGNVLLGLLEEGSDKDSLKDFVESHKADKWKRGESTEDVLAFLQSKAIGWADHDPELTLIWKRFIPRFQTLLGAEYSTKLLCKPSGPLDAILTIVWHYPTFTTKKHNYGHVFDTSNPCLRFQWQKLATVIHSHPRPCRGP
ncbi:Uu.00g113190.m01.CDS01 [Anthostomella pinea]|uniref:Uu.00g113190.m01.CDS01 n=1 Tax=Anthostomella pinea TaxID=933095 RepID=A0AAI8VGD5_9PEZI|nr:Uu.00g113190.m01.CDS01 [Anthostomella pinea]